MSTDLLKRFEAAWRTGTPPRLEDFLPPGSDTSPGARRLLLHDLIKLDLEYRWRLMGTRSGGGAECVRLEDYSRRFPALGGLQGLDPELIAEEYWVRQRWGDRPQYPEYAARFPSQGAKLHAALRAVDAELAAEFASAGRTPPALVPAAPAVAERVPADSVAALLATVRQCQLLRTAQMDGLGREQWANPRELARDLLQRGWLTAYQVNQLLKGEGPGLLLGSYILLQRLGEGGAGQVFLARHLLLNRDVALKVIRADRRTDPEVVRRFHREIGVLGQLKHPNVVHAYDAGTIGSIHFLAMEYVAGVDLGKLVKQSGPLPVAQACDFICQAVLGLQYINEHGLIHRDIKPSNLLVSGGVVSQHPEVIMPHQVKILDLGLAGFQQPMDTDGAADLTETGMVIMGTLDFMAPEQALDFHRADIRADIYSLGCTFYYLLTGQAPFGAGTLTQKLLRHQQAEPRSLDEFRRDIPAGLPAVVKRMMAKHPKDRYQRPEEVAEALTGRSPATALVACAPLLVPRPPHAISADRPPSRLKQSLHLARVSARAIQRFPTWVRIVLAVALSAGVLVGLFAMVHERPTVYLTDLEERTDGKRGESFEKGGKLGRNYGLVQVNGTYFPRTLAMMPFYTPIRASYPLGKQYRTFKAVVAVPDFYKNALVTAPVVFTVLGDQNVLWTSTPLDSGGQSQECTVSISGIERLDLVVTGRSATKANGVPLYGVWLNPQVK